MTLNEVRCPKPSSAISGKVFAYDKAGNRLTLQHDSAAITAGYAYDTRDRCTGIDQHNGSAWVDLADYTWLGGAISKRQTTCDYPGGTQPKFKTDFQRDGILRVSKVVNEHLTEGQAGNTYGSLGTFEYAYDSSSNVLTAEQNDSMGTYLEADRVPTGGWWMSTDSTNDVKDGIAPLKSVLARKHRSGRVCPTVATRGS